MKKLLLIGALLSVLCSCGSGNSKKNAAPANGVHEGHEWVDLGLPSGLKWATCNVGASTPGVNGNYYAWGETCTKSEYTESNCTSYGKTRDDIGGDSSRDAATANWGGNWRMPSKEEFQELLDNCTWKWTTQNEAIGCKVTGPNGQSIFLPAEGYLRGDELYLERFGHYWSSTPYAFDTYSAYYLSFEEFDNTKRFVYTFDRGEGLSVRPVLED